MKRIAQWSAIATCCAALAACGPAAGPTAQPTNTQNMGGAGDTGTMGSGSNTPSSNPNETPGDPNKTMSNPNNTANPNNPNRPVDPNSRNTFTGTVAGNAFNPNGAIFNLATVGGQQQLIVRMSHQASDCNDFASNIARKNSAALVFIFDANTMINMGQFAVSNAGSGHGNTMNNGNNPNSTGSAAVTFYATDGSCANKLQADQGTAQSGSIDVMSVAVTGATGSADGTFMLKMGNQNDAVSGSFAATYCPQLSNNGEPSPTAKCQ